ncbi:MAG: dTDP-4-amino-4,6-dideoxyglucose formyltransferase [Sedimentibacter sp.]|nr:dTDP-4-amino-4,6-dideoxyglucose formyltransferase [Sedimentibacter sp.]
MYKRILVISDNIIMASSFQEIFEELDLMDVSVDYSISPFSDKFKFEEKLNKGVFVYNLKSNQHLEEIIEKYDLVFSIHCKQIFPKKLINSLKCINVHPGYNPLNRGWYPQVFSIIYDLPIGATIHEMDEELDHGNIIDRELVEKETIDTSFTLYNKVIQKEKSLLKNNLFSIISNSYTTIKPENEGHLYLRDDFNKLCEIDLNRSTTAKDIINKLRALTHDEFKNAFFIDPKTGKKVFISINLEYDK